MEHILCFPCFNLMFSCKSLVGIERLSNRTCFGALAWMKLALQLVRLKLTTRVWSCESIHTRPTNHNDCDTDDTRERSRRYVHWKSHAVNARFENIRFCCENSKKNVTRTSLEFSLLKSTYFQKIWNMQEGMTEVVHFMLMSFRSRSLHHRDSYTAKLLN